MLPVVPASKLIILILGAVLVMAPVEKHYDDQIIQIGNNVIDQLVQEVDDNPQQFIQGDHRAYIDYDIVEKTTKEELQYLDKEEAGSLLRKYKDVDHIIETIDDYVETKYPHFVQQLEQRAEHNMEED
jgi:hypothetical protein